jgi:leucyl-tRNA synthetase
MWEMMGHQDGLWTSGWPVANAELAKDDQVEVPVQVNGKLRGKLTVGVGIAQEGILQLAKAEPAIAQQLNGKRIVKVVYVPNKLLNLVVA